MADQVSVCNMALMRVGHSDTISDITEDSTEAKICRVFWDMILDSVLRDVPWPFATKRVSLALVNETAPSNWTYVYAVPSDCLFARALVIPGMRIPRPDDQLPFEMNAIKIYSDQVDAELVYTSRVDNLNFWDSQSLSMLAWALAPELATALKVKPELAAYARQMYQKAQSEAIVSALSEGSDPAPNSELMDARN